MTDLATVFTPDLPDRIRSRRDELGLSQAAASKRIGVSLRTLQGWEAGSAFPQIRHRVKLAKFLNGSGRRAAA